MNSQKEYSLFSDLSIANLTSKFVLTTCAPVVDISNNFYLLLLSMRPTALQGALSEFTQLITSFSLGKGDFGKGEGKEVIKCCHKLDLSIIGEMCIKTDDIRTLLLNKHLNLKKKRIMGR